MTVITLDAIESVKELKSVGFTEDQAEVQVKLLLDAINKSEMARLEDFATKRDLKEFELRITKVIANVQIEVAGMRADVQKEIAGIGADVKLEIADLRREIAETKSGVIKWVAGMLLVQSGILIGGFGAVVKLLLA